MSSTMSVLVVTLNCWDYLDLCIRSVLSSNFPLNEIIVVDNASVDGTSEKLQKKYPDVRLIQNVENMGFVRAVNQGFKAVTGKCVLLLDSDTELNHDAIRIMYEFMEKHPEVNVVAPRILNPDRTVQESARNFPSAINGIFGRRSVLTRLLPNNPISRRYLVSEKQKQNSPYQVEHASAACIMFRKTLLDTVGLIDEGFSRFVGYWADADWCKRIQKAGEILYCIPGAVITHHDQNKPFSKKNPMRIIEFHTGAYRFYRLHYTCGSWDPRNLITALLLSARATLLLAANCLKTASDSHKDPLS